MLLFTLAFLSGDLFLQQYSKLPNIYGSISIFICVISIYLLLKNKYSSLYLVLAFVTGFTWTNYIAYEKLSWTLPKNLENKPLLIRGDIASLPIEDLHQTYFLFHLKKLKFDNNFITPKTFIKLGTRDLTTKIKVGDEWQFLVKLKRIHSPQNPASFDQEAFCFQNGIRAKGYVISSGKNSLLTHQAFHYPILKFREYLKEKIQTMMNSNTKPWLLALTIGDRSLMSHDDWEILRLTGTNHLMAIAGLHIGIAAGLMHFLTAIIWRRITYLTLRLPAKLAASIAALFAAFFYSLLSGFSIPTERACIMLCAFIIAIFMRRNITLWQAFSFAMLGVLIINPLSVLSESFWLSFTTIALIIYGMNGRLLVKGFWWRWGRVQWVVGIGLIPITLVLFQECSFISFFANSLGIPFLSVFILPLCLIGIILLMISPKLGLPILLLANKNLNLLRQFLFWCSHFSFSSWQHFLPINLSFFIIIIGFILLLLPKGFPGKALSIIWILPLFITKPHKLSSGQFDLTLLDVGQGLSAVIKTRHHILIFDTGPNFGNLNMGENVLLPYLRTLFINKLDMVVISHGNNDHVGGLKSIWKVFPIDSIKTSDPAAITFSKSNYCLANETWNWDGVKFSFIYPSKDNLALGNDSSCVLRVENSYQSILLTGDIEKYAENNLLSQRNLLKSSLLIAPHHGSKTSSSKQFVEFVSPKYVLFSTGYQNRYHFPHPITLDIYQKNHAIQLNTVKTGAMFFNINQMIEANFYRLKHHRYWMDED